MVRGSQQHMGVVCQTGLCMRALSSLQRSLQPSTASPEGSPSETR